MLYVLNNAHQSLPTQDLGVTCCACGRGQMIFGDILYIMCKLCLHHFAVQKRCSCNTYCCSKPSLVPDYFAVLQQCQGHTVCIVTLL